jgi:hypothetical protein
MKNEELDSNWTIKNSRIIYVPTEESFEISKQERDSFYVNFESVDTLFQIDRDHVLRRKKSYYYLNTLMYNGGWGVERLHLANKRLNYHSLSGSDDVNKLKEITGQDTDTIPFHLSKKQFRAFIRKGGFEEKDVFIKY